MTKCPNCNARMWFERGTMTWHCTRITAFCNLIYTIEGYKAMKRIYGN